MSKLAALLAGLLIVLGTVTWNQHQTITRLKQDNRDLMSRLSLAEKRPLVLENVLIPLCEEAKEVEKIVTRTVTQIKEIPYEVEICSGGFPADLGGLLDKAFYDLRLQAPPDILNN